MPRLAGCRSTTRRRKVAPWDAPFHCPPEIAISGLVNRAAHGDAQLNVKPLALHELGQIAHAFGPWEKRIEDRPVRIELKLVVARVLLRRLQEDLEHVVVPHRAVVLRDRVRHIGVVHLR